MALSLRSSCREIISSNQCRKRFLTRQFFYSEDPVQVYRPFNNTVEVKLKKSASITNSEHVQHTTNIIKKHLATFGNVNGHCFRGKSFRTGYFNFLKPEEKQAALEGLCNHGNSIPFSEIKSFEFGDEAYHRHYRPFKNLMVVPYRPSIHSVGRIIEYLEKVGNSTGHEEVKCPYDEDRRFLYFSFRDKRALNNPDINFKNSFINASHACSDEGFSDTRCQCKDVHLFPFQDHDESRYKKMVLIRTSQNVLSGRLRDYLNRKYGKSVDKIEKVGTDDRGSRFLVTFTDSFPVHRMFYPTTQYGQLVETIPLTSDNLYITMPNLPKSVWKHQYLRLFNVPPISGDKYSYFNNFLDNSGCNPGIVAVSQTTASYFSVDLANRLRENPNLLTDPSSCDDTYYELYFANPFHAVDVCHRLIQLKNDGIHQFHCAVDVALFNSIRRYLV